jgi:hypothetical protein
VFGKFGLEMAVTIEAFIRYIILKSIINPGQLATLSSETWIFLSPATL